VDFGTTPAASFTVNNATRVTATASAASSLGTVDVSVTIPAGTSATSSADHYTYTAPSCPARTTVDIRWHYSADGSAGRGAPPQSSPAGDTFTVGSS
jgi:hypothetical protein